MNVRLNYIYVIPFFTVTGIWIRDIRGKTNLSSVQLNKVIKSLEQKKLIKAVKSVTVLTLLIIGLQVFWL